jgi:hypothetical protein
VDPAGLLVVTLAQALGEVEVVLRAILVLGDGRGGSRRVDYGDQAQDWIRQQILEPVNPVRTLQRGRITPLQAVEELGGLVGHAPSAPVAAHGACRVRLAVDEVVNGRRRLSRADEGAVLAQQCVDERALARVHLSHHGDHARLSDLPCQPAQRLSHCCGRIGGAEAPRHCLERLARFTLDRG